MPLPSTVHIHPPAALSTALGAYLVAAVSSALQRHGRFIVALSGGSLPSALTTALASAAASGADLHTEAWHVFYADERLVPVDHPDSNHAACLAALAGQSWFRVPAAQMYPINASLAPAECAVSYAASIQSAFGEAPARFDLVLLGMGPDGHTASLFPGHPLMHEAGGLVAAITDSPKPPSSRVTLTLPAINAAHSVAFVATGASKADAMYEIFGGPHTVPVEPCRLPAGLVRQAGNEAPAWFVDPAAVSRCV